MNNVLEFFVKMRDLTQATVGKVIQGAKKMQEQTNKANTEMNRLGDSVRRVGSLDPSSAPVNGMRKIQAEAERTVRAVKKIEETVDNQSKGGGNGFLKGLGKRLLPLLALGSVIAGAKSAAQASIQFESTNKSFEVLSGNKGIGRALSGELNSLQQNTILGPEVFKNAQTMMGFGIGAEKVIPHLKMLGEVSMGDADKLQRLTLAFSQVQAAGKLTGQDLLQFINAGFNPLQEISKNTGTALADLKKKMEDGAISADMVTQAFQSATGKGGLFNGMLDQMGGTTGGKIAQLKGGFEALKIAVGDRMTPAIGTATTILTKLVNGMRMLVEVPVVTRLNEQIDRIRALHAEITSVNTSHDRQLAIFRELEQINPNLVKGIDAQKISYGELAKNIDAVTNGLRSKIALEQFNNENAGVMSRYQSAKDQQTKAFGNIWSVVGQVLDDKTLGSTSMSQGQKQMEAMRILNERIAAKGDGGLYNADITGTGMSSYDENIDKRNKLFQAIKTYNQQEKLIQGLNPQVKAIQDKNTALQKTIDGVLGIGSMTTAQIQNNGGKATGNASMTTEGKDVASGITGGGPRVININGGVKIADKIDMHANTMSENLDDLESRFEDMLLRVLNSGASIQ